MDIDYNGDCKIEEKISNEEESNKHDISKSVEKN